MPFAEFNTELLKDRNSLYLNGRWLGSAAGFAIVGKKGWSPRGKFDPEQRNHCGFIDSRSFDVIVRTDRLVIVNSTPIDADPETFQIVRWIPDSLLVYRDKNGVKRYTFGWPDEGPFAKEYCRYTFNLLEDRVTWRSRGSQNGYPVVEQEPCQTETIPDLDPELFHPISDTVAQYKDRLYVVNTTEFGERRLDVITLDDPNLIVDKRFNAGKNHGYLLTEWRRGSAQTGFEMFESSGPLVMLNDGGNKRLFEGGWYARDDRYVYIFNGFQLYRYETADPAAARVFEADSYCGSEKCAYLATVEGVYNNSGVLIPLGQ